MLSPRYRHCISLGTGCQTAYHLRLRLGCSEAHFFDWLVTPVPALLRLVEGGFSGLFDRADDFVSLLAQTDQKPGMLHEPLRHRPLDILFYHDFAPGLARSDLGEVREKYRFLATRWKAAVAEGGPILFVRHLVEPAEAVQIVELMRRCYPELDFMLLAVRETDAPEPSWGLPRIINTTVWPTPFEDIARGIAGPRAWIGDTEGWREAFVLAGALKAD